MACTTIKVGDRFGKLITIERMENVITKKNGWHCSRPKWRCKCDCGNEIITEGRNLKRFVHPSCGCANHKPEGESHINALYIAYKINAKNMNRVFEIPKDIFKDLILGNCFYCGALPSQVMTKKEFYGKLAHNGIDRIDNSKGYSLDNIVTCCWKCNQAKHDISVSEFRTLIIDIYNHWASI